MTPVVMSDVRLIGTDERVDVWIADGVVTAITPHAEPVAPGGSRPGRVDVEGERLDGSAELSDPPSSGARAAAESVVNVGHGHDAGVDTAADNRITGTGIVHGTGFVHGTGIIHGRGRVVMRGLWDEHTHFRQWALGRRRLDLAGATSARDAAERIRVALASRRGARSTRFDASGFRDGLWSDQPTTRLLDEVSLTTPIVVVSGDLHCGWMNTAGLRVMGLSEEHEGVVREGEWIPHLDRLRLDTAETHEALRDAAESAAGRGVVGMVDMETDDNLARWPERVADGVRALRVEAAVWNHQLDAAIGAGVRSGDAVDGTEGRVHVGPMKVILDGSLNTRTAYCFDEYAEESQAVPGGHGQLALDPAALERVIRRAVEHGFIPAVHAIGDHANRIALDVFERLRASGLSVEGGRIEHAQLVTATDVPRFAALGLIASVQPEHAMDDRDISDLLWPGKAELSFRLRDLVDSGAEIRFGSDAPVAPLDPWLAIAAAVTRSRDGREPWGEGQRLSRAEALRASTRGRAELRVGDRADIVLLGADPLTCSEQTLREMPVALTLLGGAVTWAEESGGVVPSP